MIQSRLQSGLTGRYRIDRLLGEGGMATVWLVEDLRHHRLVALKVLRPEVAATLGSERFQREIEIVAGLRHPNILPLYDSGESDGLLYYVMPWVEGESLRARMNREPPLTLDEALHATGEVGSALSYAHAHDVVHRDIKPENILLEAGHALVTDFGIARALMNADGSGTTGSGVILGTPLYMSPEQSSGDPDFDERSDLYSLACVLFEMLCGESPIRGASPEAILVQRFTEPPPFLSTRRRETPRHLDVALHRAMARDRADRFPTVQRFIEALKTPASRPAAATEKSIAVLPFASMSGMSGDEFFSDGITEEIMNALAQIPGLRVAARTSAFSFKGKNQDLRLVGEKLNVTTVLEGSVRRSENRLRVTVQLVDVMDGYQLWSERYDRDLTDVFEIQEQIAIAIASRLKVTLAAGAEHARRGVASVEAYEQFLKGRVLQWRRGRWVLPALQCFEKGVELDPQFADAFAWMSDSHRLLGIYGGRRPGDSMPMAKAFAERALSLDPDLAEAHATLANVALVYDLDFPAAERFWRRSLEIQPKSVRSRCEHALWWLSMVRGAFDEAVDEAQEAVNDDPISSWAAAMNSMVLTAAGRLDLAIREGLRAVELDAESFLAIWSLMNAHVFARDFPRVIAMAQRVLPASGRHPWILGRLAGAYAGLGNPSAAEAVYEELRARARTEYVQPLWIAASAGATGRLDEAMEFSFQALEERDPVFMSLGLLPDWDPIRTHPRFAELMSRAGLSSTPTT